MDEQNLPRTREDILVGFETDFIEGFKRLVLEIQRSGEYGNSELEDLDYSDLGFEFSGKIDHDTFRIKLVHEVGGGEGEGETVERVWEVIDTFVDKSLGFAMLTGFYTSYNGTDWDSTLTRVYPRQVTVTQYFDKPE
jgi:hypothetical protein